MRISDWSSDVCSSDLHDLPPEFRHDPVAICQVGCRDGLVNRRPFRAYWGLIAAFGMLTGCHAAPPTYDIIIRQGTIYDGTRSEEHTSELQSLMRISYAVFCLKKKKPSNLN